MENKIEASSKKILVTDDEILESTENSEQVPHYIRERFIEAGMDPDAEFDSWFDHALQGHVYRQRIVFVPKKKDTKKCRG